MLLVRLTVVLYIHLYVPHVWRYQLSYDLSPMSYLRRVIDFHFVQLFSCCEDVSDDLQASYVLEQKVEVPCVFLILLFCFCKSIFFKSRYLPVYGGRIRSKIS